MLMHQGMALNLTGDAAVDFVRGMLPHHMAASPRPTCEQRLRVMLLLQLVMTSCCDLQVDVVAATCNAATVVDRGCFVGRTIAPDCVW